MVNHYFMHASTSQHVATGGSVYDSGTPSLWWQVRYKTERTPARFSRNPSSQYFLRCLPFSQYQYFAKGRRCIFLFFVAKVHLISIRAKFLGRNCIHTCRFWFLTDGQTLRT